MRIGKIGGALLIAALALMTACGEAPNSPQNIDRVIQYWDYPRPAEVDRWQREQIALFEQRHPGYRVDLQQIAWQSGPQKLDVAVFSGHPPDIVGSVSNLIAYVDQGVVESWDEVLTPEQLADFYPSSLQPCQWDGRLWAIPWYKTAHVMILNLTLFKEAGVEPPVDGRWTWEEFVDKMKRLTRDRDGDRVPDRYGIGFNVYPEEFEAWGFLFTEGTEILSDDGRQCLFDSPATTRGLQKLHDLVHTYRVAPLQSGSTRHYQTWNEFSEEWKTAVTCQGIWAINAQRRKNERAEQAVATPRGPGQRMAQPMDFDIALFPAPATQAPVLASPGVGNLVVFKQSDPERARLCFELVLQIALGEGQKVLATYPLFPTCRSAGNIFEGDPLLGGLLPYVVNAKARPMHPEWVNIDRILSKQMQLAVLGEQSAADSVREGARRVQELLDRYFARRDRGLQPKTGQTVPVGEDGE